jgi:hypothetical protein
MNRLLALPLLIVVAACDSPAPVPKKNEQEAAHKAAVDQRLDTFKLLVNTLDDPDDILKKLEGKKPYSKESQVVNDRLEELLSEKIKSASNKRELRSFKKYVLPGSNLIVLYTQRESELSN